MSYTKLNKAFAFYCMNKYIIILSKHRLINKIGIILMKNYGVILAGGTGTRIGGDIPKQFIKLHGKPIIIRTLEKFLCDEMFDFVYIAMHSDYIDNFKCLLNEFSLNQPKIKIINGGKERINSLENIMNVICQNNIDNDDVVVIHDGVRPFVSKEILSNSIKTAREFGACVATVPATDTMYVLDNNNYIKDIPQRKTIFNGQAPDSFRINILKNALDSLTEEERKFITGTVQICMLKGYPVKTIKGDYKNIKITTQDDIYTAEKFLEMETQNESLCS